MMRVGSGFHVQPLPLRPALAPVPCQLSLLCALAASCTSETAPPAYVEMDYQLRCPMCPGAIDPPARSVRALAGADGLSVVCAVSSVGELTFSARGSEYGIQLLNAAVAGPDPSRCQVIVTEGANNFEGRCSSLPPAPGVPCQVQFQQAPGGWAGTVLCVDLPHRLQPSERRTLAAPPPPGAPALPAMFRLQGC